MKPSIAKFLIFFCLLNTIGFSQGSTCNDFVKVDGKKFKCGNTDFFALVTNYVVELVHSTGSSGNTIASHFPSRYHAYAPDNMVGPQITDAATAYNGLVKDFTDMKSKGFNCVRVVGIGFGTVCTSINTYSWTCNAYSAYPALSSWNPSGNDNQIIDITTNTQLLLDIYQKILDAAAAANIKVILLVGGNSIFDTNQTIYNAYTSFLGQFATRFKYNSTLMAVDFANEPTVSGNYWAYKKNACNMTAAWYEAIKSNSNILTTLGSWEVGDVLFWDPNVLHVDFLSLHNYPVCLDKTNLSDLQTVINGIKSDYYWYKNNVNIPWIVGETGMSAHPNNTSHPINNGAKWDSGPSAGTISDQANYLNQTLNASRDYGAAGYSWWTYMDEMAMPDSTKWPLRDENNYPYKQPGGGPFWGLAYANEGNTPVSWKPAANYISSFNPTPNPANAVQPSNYYNYRNFPPTYFVTGKVVQEGTQLPIKDAFIEAEDANKKWINTTYTNAQGDFTIYSNVPIYKIDVTATGYSKTETVIPQNGANLGNISLTKIYRPTTTDLFFTNANRSNVQEYHYASNSIHFDNYVINSGSFSAKTGSYIKLKTGFSVKKGVNFNARIGPYFVDCNSIKKSDGTIFRTSENKDLYNVENESFFKVYPNPNTGIINIESDEDKHPVIYISNLIGQVLYEKKIFSNLTTIDISNYQNGVYFINLKYENEKPQITKIILSK